MSQVNHPSRWPRRSPVGRSLALFAGLVGGALALLGMLSAARSVRAAPALQAEPVLEWGAEADAAAPELAALAVNTAVADKVRPGGRLVYTLRYTNTTAVAVPGVVISSTLSPGQSQRGDYQATPPIPLAQYARDGLKMSWRLGTLAAGASGSIRLETDVASEPEPSAEQIIRLVGDSVVIFAADPNVSGGEDNAAAKVVGPILELTKGDGPDPVLPGHLLTYTLTLLNKARQDAIPATGVLITDTVPEHTRFYRVSAEGSFDESSGLVVWRPASPVPPGARVDVWFSVLVDEDTLAGTTLVNDRDVYRARSSELHLSEVRGKSRITTAVAGLLQKSVVAPRILYGMPTVYPGERVTYTLKVYNPRPVALRDVQVLDTLAGQPGPFQYLQSMPGSPEPDVFGRDLGWVVDLPPWGSIERVFAASVPSDTFIADNSQLGSTYPSTLTARHADFNFPPNTNAAPLRVYPPVVMDKVVAPAIVQGGETVAYTVTLTNRADFDIRGVVLTDTMDGPLFHYVSMNAGPPPVDGQDTNPVLWTNLSVPAGGRTVLGFNAYASGFPLQGYYNNLAARSPDTYIPIRTKLAQVKIDSPFRIEKTVSPTETLIGGSLRYDIRLFNVTTTTWTLDRVEDTLPPGVIQQPGGLAVAKLVISPPASIQPGASWSGSFNAEVGGEARCNDLPKNYPNARGAIKLFFSAPVAGIFANAGDLATLRLKPHTSATLTPFRRTVLPGTVITYSLHLSNDSDQAGTNSAFKLTLPEDFRYIDSLRGYDPMVDQNKLTWSGIQLPAHGTLDLVFLVQTGQKLGGRTSTFEATAEGSFCIQRLSNAARVDVVRSVDDIFALSNKPFAAAVAPRMPVDFEIRLANKDPDPYRLRAMTDTLPSGFEYLAMPAGPEPEVRGDRLIWRNVVVPGRTTVVWKLRLNSSALFGAYQNVIAAYVTNLDLQPSTSSAVNVVPLIQLSKLAGRPYPAPGETVPYTITLLNLTASRHDHLTLTDTLPAPLTFARMVLGEAPSALGPGKDQPVWTNLSVGANGGLRTLVFEAQVPAGAAEGVYYNSVVGSGRDVFIPGTDQTAPITVTIGSAPPTPTTGPASPTPSPRPGTPTRTPVSATPTTVPTRPPNLDHYSYLPLGFRSRAGRSR